MGVIKGDTRSLDYSSYEPWIIFVAYPLISPPQNPI